MTKHIAMPPLTHHNNYFPGREGRVRVGFALSGAAARSVFYIGFLEGMEKENIPVDVIAAQSGAAAVAAAYSCGTLERLKRDFIPIDKTKFRKLLMVRSKQPGGMYTLDSMEDYGREFWTLGKTFEDVKPQLCFAAADLTTGTLVALAMGDIARAVRISCTVPGLFAPVQWGSHSLVDGGLVSFIPSDMARQSGADIVIGVNVRATQHIFLKSQMRAKHVYNLLKRRLFLHRVGTLWKAARKVVEKTDAWDYFEPLEFLGAELDQPGMFSVLGTSLDVALKASARTERLGPLYGCDFLIREGTGNFGGSVRVNDMETLYKQGRTAAHQYAPQIKLLIDQYHTAPAIGGAMVTI